MGKKEEPEISAKGLSFFSPEAMGGSTGLMLEPGRTIWGIEGEAGVLGFDVFLSFLAGRSNSARKK